MYFTYINLHFIYTYLFIKYNFNLNQLTWFLSVLLTYEFQTMNIRNNDYVALTHLRGITNVTKKCIKPIFISHGLFIFYLSSLFIHEV